MAFLPRTASSFSTTIIENIATSCGLCALASVNFVDPCKSRVGLFVASVATFSKIVLLIEVTTASVFIVNSQKHHPSTTKPALTTGKVICKNGELPADDNECTCGSPNLGLLGIAPTGVGAIPKLHLAFQVSILSLNSATLVFKAMPEPELQSLASVS